MSREKLEKTVLTAVFCAIVVAMTFIPYVGYIRYSPLSLEVVTIHVVVILGAAVLGPVRGSVVGGVWGLFSLIYALLFPSGASPIMLNPLVSVVPRIIVGFVSAWVFRGFSKLFKNPYDNKSLTISLALTGVIGTLTNTVLVLTMYQIFDGVVKFGGILKGIYNVIFAVNGGIEILLAVVVVPAIGVPLINYIRKNKNQAV